MKNEPETQKGRAASGRGKWLVLAVLLLAYFVPNYMQYQLSPISQEIMQTYSMTPAMFAKVFSAPMIPAVFLSLVSGILTDKYGAKPVLGTSLAICAGGSVLRYFSSTYFLLFLSMVLIGVAGAIVNANGVKVISGHFPKERISFFTGTFLASSTVAMTLGTGTTTLFPSLSAVYLTGVILAVLVMILWFLFAGSSAPGYANAAPVSLRSAIKKVTGSQMVWLAGVSLFFIMACLIGIVSFLPMALAGRGMDTVTAGTYTAVFTAGNLVGSFLSPAIDHGWKHTRALILIQLLLIGLGTAFAWCLPFGFLLFAVLLITGISIGGILPILMSLPIRFGEVPAEHAGIAGGIVCTLQLLGALVLPSYIVAPVAGDNHGLFFLISGCLMIIPVIINGIAAVRSRSAAG